MEVLSGNTLKKLVWGEKLGDRSEQAFNCRPVVLNWRDMQQCLEMFLTITTTEGVGVVPHGI